MGKYAARLAKTSADLRASQHLRHLAFCSAPHAPIHEDGLDSDRFDDECEHVLVEECATGRLLCSYRFKTFSNGAKISGSYSAQFYDLSSLELYQGHAVEVGRFCTHPSVSDPDLLRVAWASLTKLVDDRGIELLFGCSSFAGTDVKRYADAFALLRDNHLAPQHWQPKVKAPEIFKYALAPKQVVPANKAKRRLPPLLKTYLLMGGWVSDHAVIDRQLNTLHLFTGVEVKSIPPARKRLLRALLSAPA